MKEGRGRERKGRREEEGGGRRGRREEGGGRREKGGGRREEGGRRKGVKEDRAGKKKTEEPNLSNLHFRIEINYPTIEIQHGQIRRNIGDLNHVGHLRLPVTHNLRSF
jgi:hypothetical protein